MHEHFFFGYPGYAGDTTFGSNSREDVINTGIDVAERAKARGVETIVDATPNDCGRDPEMLREISERAEIKIICSTGYYCEAEGAPAYFKFRQGLGSAPGEIEKMTMTEITSVIGGTGIKAGVIKLASSKDAISDYEKMFFGAGAKAQKETGIPIITHTHEGTMGPEQAEMLVGAGVDPNRVMIGHMNGNTDVSYHIATLTHGVNIAFDRFGIQGIVGALMDVMRQTCLIGLLGMGYGDRIALSHDTVNVWLGRPLVLPDAVAELLANWHIAHLFDNVVPIIKRAGISDEQIDGIFIENPKRIFGG